MRLIQPLFRIYVHDAEMAVILNTASSDDDLAMLWPNTAHTRWGQEGFKDCIGAKGDDFVVAVISAPRSGVTAGRSRLTDP